MLIALSGGADSVALLIHLQECGEAEAAAHCNFHLRGTESDRDESFVRHLCEERGIPLFVRHFDTLAEASRTGESIEMAARRLRYEWFRDLCAEHGYAAVAVAHHQDDNAETILLNLLRGTGLRGLCGMQPERDGVVRPLLGWTRERILRFLEEHHQPYVTDSTNADTRYRRNFIRHRLLPMLEEINPQVVATLNRMGRQLQEVEQVYLCGLKARALELRRTYFTGYSVDYASLAALPEARTLLHEWLSPYGFTAEQTEAALAMKVGALLETRSSLCTRTHTALQWCRKPLPFHPVPIDGPEGEVQLPAGRVIRYRTIPCKELTEIPRTPSVIAIDADSLQGAITLRAIAEADRFQPFGMKGTKLVSDFLTDRHASRIDKMQALAVADGQGIVWLVGHRIDQRVAITPSTRRVLLMQDDLRC